MSHRKEFLGSSNLLLHLLLLFGSTLQLHAQLQMPSSYLPKEYFLSSGGRRDPRHVPSDFQTAASTATTTSTYHLNPQAPTNSLGLATTSTNSAIHAMNNQFGIRLVPHNQVRVEGVGGDEGASRRTRRKLKGGSTRHRRRLPKSLLRPPKEYIIYSLPEQSFWAPERPQEGTAEERSTGGGGIPQEQTAGRSETELAEEEEGAPLPTPGHLRGGGLPREEDDEQEERRGASDEEQRVEEALPHPQREQEQQEQQQQQQLPQEEEEPLKNNVVDLNDAPNPTLSERKVLLGQCMRSCIDALL